jgi:hypothetical protein
VSTLLPQSQLVQARIFLFLLADALSDDLLIPADSGDEVSARPKVLPHEVALALRIHPRQVDRTLPLMSPTTCATAYFRGIAINMGT